MMIPSAFAADPAPPVSTETAVGVAEPVPYELTQEKMFKDTLIFVFLMFAIFYFLLIRPQQKRVKAHKDLLAELKKGDRVVTAGGIIGSIVKFEGGDVAVVEIAPSVRVRMSRASISEKVSADVSTADTANDN